MDSIGPWWGGPIIGLAGAVFGVVVSSTFTLLSERMRRRRLSYERKVEAYPALSAAASSLARLPVWQDAAAGPPTEFDQLRDRCVTTAFFGSRRVNKAIARLVRDARSHSELIELVRESSKAGHSDTIDRRFVDRYQSSVAQLKTAIDEFVQAARVNLEITDRYWPIDGDERPAQAADYYHE